MKCITIIFITLFIFASKINAQAPSVENSLWGVQVGIHPFAIYKETKLTTTINLRSELGFGVAWAKNGSYQYSDQWAIIPCIVLEPRFYYNLKKRLEKNKRIDGNSGNFVSLYIGFEPGFGIVSKNVNLFPTLSTIPMWGLKRNIGEKFNFETALGIGYSWTYEKYTQFNGNKIRNTATDIAFGLRLAFGYKF